MIKKLRCKLCSEEVMFPVRHLLLKHNEKVTGFIAPSQWKEITKYYFEEISFKLRRDKKSDKTDENENSLAI